MLAELRLMHAQAALSEAEAEGRNDYLTANMRREVEKLEAELAAEIDKEAELYRDYADLL